MFTLSISILTHTTRLLHRLISEGPDECVSEVVLLSVDCCGVVGRTWSWCHHQLVVFISGDPNKTGKRRRCTSRRKIVRKTDQRACVSRLPIWRVVDRVTHLALGSGMAGLVLCGVFYFSARIFWHECFLPTSPVFEFFTDGVIIAVGS